jgi:hypothetical protein
MIYFICNEVVQTLPTAMTDMTLFHLYAILFYDLNGTIIDAYRYK